MSGAESYAEEVAPWPTDTPTASDLLRYFTVASLHANVTSSTWAHEYHRHAIGEAPPLVAACYHAAVGQAIAMHDVRCLLEPLLDVAPTLADMVAESIWLAAEAGDSYGEEAWVEVDKLGLDADRICDETKAAVEAQIAEAAS